MMIKFSEFFNILHVRILENLLVKNIVDFHKTLKFIFEVELTVVRFHMQRAEFPTMWLFKGFKNDC